jgi:hypothetical protein
MDVAAILELRCQKCGGLMHVEVENAFAAEVAARLARFIACSACSAPAPSRPKPNLHASTENWMARSNPNH